MKTSREFAYGAIEEINKLNGKTLLESEFEILTIHFQQAINQIQWQDGEPKEPGEYLVLLGDGRLIRVIARKFDGLKELQFAAQREWTMQYVEEEDIVASFVIPGRFVIPGELQT